MKADDVSFLAGVLKQRSGLSLSADKAYLLESRLTPLARRQGLASLDELVVRLRNGRDEALVRRVTEAMTTNESSFFRDGRPFETFRRELLPGLLQARAAQRHIRIWCAAASTGQEPYSLAMLLKEEQAKLAGWRIEILGTDLASEVLGRARDGVYTQFEVQRGVPAPYLVKYFDQVPGGSWRLKDGIRSMVQFREFNLLGDLAPLGRFDVVLCRNVLIYFDQETKRRVLENMARLLPRDGLLLLGAAETVLGLTEKFAPLPAQRGVYGLA